MTEMIKITGLRVRGSARSDPRARELDQFIRIAILRIALNRMFYDHIIVTSERPK